MREAEEEGGRDKKKNRNKSGRQRFCSSMRNVKHNRKKGSDASEPCERRAGARVRACARVRARRNTSECFICQVKLLLQ